MLIDSDDVEYIDRVLGAKGMISLDSRLEGEILCLRPSMIKFEATSTEIEICGAGFKPLPFYLNRQIVRNFLNTCPIQSNSDLENSLDKNPRGSWGG